MAMQKDGPAHAGIDNQAAVLSVTEITEHQNIRKDTKLVNEKGDLIAGGRTTQYHRQSKSKRPWSLVKNGDLCQSMEEAAIAKGTKIVKASKVKGHAIEEMVEAGKAKREDKIGNAISDEGADKGAEITNMKAAALGHVYSKRHKYYKTFMQKVQSFILKVRKMDT